MDSVFNDGFFYDSVFIDGFYCDGDFWDTSNLLGKEDYVEVYMSQNRLNDNKMTSKRRHYVCKKLCYWI